MLAGALEAAGIRELPKELCSASDAVETVARLASALVRFTRAGSGAVSIERVAANRYVLAVDYEHEGAAVGLVEAAVRCVGALAASLPFDLAAHVEAAARGVARGTLGPSTRAIVEAASRRGIPVERLNDASLVMLGYGTQRRFVQAALASTSSAIAVDIASDKHLTKALLERVGVPVPRGACVRTADEAVAAARRIGGRVATKPLDAQQGRGVCLNLESEADIRDAFAIARDYSEIVVVEECFAGNDYRVLVVGGRLVAASERMPASVVGDGRRTIAELVEAENRDPRRGAGHEKPLTVITADDEALHHLARQGHSLDSVPRLGERVFLRACANLSKGGTARDVTDIVHPEVRSMCERAARAVGLDICGIDLVAEDISRPLGERAGIIEVNAAPGLRMHEHPSDGQPRRIGDAIVEMLYPAGATGRVPVIAVAGARRAALVARAVAGALDATGACVGLVTRDGVSIGGEPVAGARAIRGARAVLADPLVDVVLVEIERDEVERDGLAFDWADVVVVTGIRGADDMAARVIRLAAERVRSGGALVLNADDDAVVRLREVPAVAAGGRDVVLFSVNESSLVVRRHVDRGGRAYFVRDGWIVEAAGGRETPVLLNGSDWSDIAARLAAVAACRAHGLGLTEAAAALRAPAPVAILDVEARPRLSA